MGLPISASMQPPAQPVVWITGLSGAGKTTLANSVVTRLRVLGHSVVHLDGDQLREVLGGGSGYSHGDRLRTAFCYARMCRHLQTQGALVVCSTMSLYPEIWEWNTQNMSPYLQVYLDVAMPVLFERDQKGLYTGVRSGTSSNVVGVDIEFTPPTKWSDLVLRNNQPQDLAENTELVVRRVRARLPAARRSA